MANWISIHALREESDQGKHIKGHNNYISIHALREESDKITPFPMRVKIYYFNPRSPRGERQLSKVKVGALYMISIHALREESDVTTPAVSDASAISIHALREESDPWDKATQTVRDNFNPSSPWGERHFLKLDVYIHTQHFNPRSPWGERLDYFSFVSKCDDISIHALREESDIYTPFQLINPKFQSTLSVRRATPQAN